MCLSLIWGFYTRYLWTILPFSCYDTKKYFLKIFFKNYSATERKIFYEFQSYYISTLIKHKASLIMKVQWYAVMLWLFHSSSAVCSCLLSEEAVLGWTDFCFHGWSLLCFSDLMQPFLSPSGKMLTLWDIAWDLVLVLYIWHFWISPKLLWLTGKWIREESVI